MLLEWRGRREDRSALVTAARRIERAVERVLANAATRTRDIGGTLGTDAFADAVVSALGSDVGHGPE